MATLDFQKVDVLPATLAANTIYLIKPASGNIATIYITDKTGTVAYRTLNAQDLIGLGSSGGSVSAGTVQFLAG